MRFLIDRCAGRKLAEWLKNLGHDVVESRLLGPDPGDLQLLEWACAESAYPGYNRYRFRWIGV